MTDRGPVTRYLDELARRRAGAAPPREIDGFLDVPSGFLAPNPPAEQLPASHAAWDEVARDLPSLWRRLRVRDALDRLPTLAADETALADRDLHRAASLLGILAHAYVRNGVDVPNTLPDALTRPWAQVSGRLGRRRPDLTIDDLITANFRRRGPGPFEVENLELVTPVTGSEAERRFHAVMFELLAVSSPLVGWIATAQDALAVEEWATAAGALDAMTEIVWTLTLTTLPKLSPNPYHPTYVDPVLFGRSVAPFTVPIADGLHGVTGSSAPFVPTLDVFVGRPPATTVVGRGADSIRGSLSPAVRGFLGAVAAMKLTEVRHRDRRLDRAIDVLLDAWAGERGFLGRHRTMAYGYLEVAFKVGRPRTNLGFSRALATNAWQEAATELELSRRERPLGSDDLVVPVPVVGTRAFGGDPHTAVTHLSLDHSESGLSYRPGDRCAVTVEHDPALVRRTLRALRTSGATRIRLDGTWRAAAVRLGLGLIDELEVGTLLRYGRLRPVGPDQARTLASLRDSSTPRTIVREGTHAAWEMWDLLELLTAGGFDPAEIVHAEPWERHSLCRLFPPDQPRLYSIASAPPHDGDPATLDLAVAGLTYTSGPAGHERSGSASGYLRRQPASVRLGIVRTSTFRVPDDDATPIVMFAAGSGIAPFRGFLAERARHPRSGPALLLLSVAGPDRLPFREELERWVAEGRLDLRVTFTRAAEAGAPRGIAELCAEPALAARLAALVVDQSAAVYVCGRAEFATTVETVLLDTLTRTLADAERARELLRRMAANGTYCQDVFTSYAHAAAPRTHYRLSEVARHRDDEHGWWMVIHGQVYDVTEFRHVHAGGRRILDGNSGVDATVAYEAAHHHFRPEVEAMLSQHRLGALGRPRLRTHAHVWVSPTGLCSTTEDELYDEWAGALHTVLELALSLRNELDVLRLPLTAHEPAGLTPEKVALLADTRRRWHTASVELRRTVLPRLWAMTVGQCAPDEPVGGFEAEVAEALTDDTLADLLQGAAEAWSAVATGGDVPAPAPTAALVEAVRDQLLGFAERLVAALIRGIETFETHQVATTTRGASTLLATLREVASAYAGARAAAASTAEDFRRDTPDVALPRVVGPRM